MHDRKRVEVALVALALLASCAHALRRLRAAPLIDALRSEWRTRPRESSRIGHCPAMTPPSAAPGNGCPIGFGFAARPSGRE